MQPPYHRVQHSTVIMTKSNDKTPHKKNQTSAKHGKPTGAKMKILNAAAATKATTGEDLDRDQISALSGVSGASTIRNALAALKKSHWIEVTPTKIIVTPTGWKVADPCQASVPTSNAEYHETTKKHFKLKPKACAVFDFLVDGRKYERQAIADAVFDGKTNSTFRNTLAALNKHKLIEREGSLIWLADKMFPIVSRSESI